MLAAAQSAPDPKPPAEFPKTWNSWVLTSVVSGNYDLNISGNLTHNFGQVISVSGDGNWSCRTQQSELLKPADKVPGDFCEYSAHNRSHRSDTRQAAQGGSCTTSALDGALPKLAFPKAVLDKFMFLGVDKVNQKMCNHWTALGVSPGVDIDFWASVNDSFPCEISQRRSLTGGNWDITTWAFDGFNTVIPHDTIEECMSLKCGAKPLKCAAKENVTDEQLGGALGWVCDPQNLDCTPIQPGGDHYQPNTLTDHCNWAFEAFYSQGKGSCDFGGVAELTRGSSIGNPVPSMSQKGHSIFELDLACTSATPIFEVLV